MQQTVDGWRVIIIEPAEALNTASANALLKTLEEPGDRVLIILLATVGASSLLNQPKL